MKPNFGGSKKGVYTNPEVVKAVTNWLMEDLHVKEVIIADGTAVKYHPTVRLVDFNHGQAIKLAIPNGYVLKELWLPRAIVEVADVVISVPVVKT